MNPPQVPRYLSADYGEWVNGRSITLPLHYSCMNMQNPVHPSNPSSDHGGYGESNCLMLQELSITLPVFGKSDGMAVLVGTAYRRLVS